VINSKRRFGIDRSKRFYIVCRRNPKVKDLLSAIRDEKKMKGKVLRIMARKVLRKRE
jgi:hypothetical protein